MGEVLYEDLEELVTRHTAVTNQHPATLFTFEGRLGSGNFGELHAVRRIADKSRQYACKSIITGGGVMGPLLSAMEQLLSCDHESLITISDVMIYSNTLYLFSDLVPSPADNGKTKVSPDLYSWLLEPAPVGLGDEFATEGQVAAIVHQIASGIDYLNGRGMLHGNLRLENVLVGPAGISELKLSDFGMASIAKTKEANESRPASTVGYTAPELLRSASGKESQKTDIFALGVLTYVAFVKRSPFGFGESAHNAVLSGKYSMGSEWGNVSAAAQKLVRDMLDADPNKRPSAQKILSSGWMWSNGFR